MRKFLSILRVEWRDYFHKLTTASGVGKKRDWALPLGILLIFSMFTSLFMMGRIYSDALFAAYQAFGQPELAFTVMYTIVSLLSFVATFASIIGLLYYARNKEFYLALPIEFNQVVWARLSLQYLMTASMVWPLILSSIFKIQTIINYSILSIISSFLIMLLLPVIPLIISSILVMLVMRVLSRFISKKFISVVVNFTVMIFIFANNMLMNRVLQNPEVIEQMLQQEHGVLYLLGSAFPPSILATRAMMGEGLWLLGFILLNIIVFLIGNKLVVPLMGRYEGGDIGASPKRRRKAHYVAIKKRPLFRTLVKRNLDIIIQTPAFLMQASAGIMMPIIMVFSMLAGSSGDFGAMVKALQAPEAAFLRNISPVILAIMGAMNSLMAAFGATVITREGKYLWQLRVLPIAAKTDLTARLVSCLLLDLPGLAMSIPIMAYLFGMSWFQVLLGIALSMLLSLITSQIDIYINTRRPALNWTNPTQAVKNNMNVFIALGWRFGVALLSFIIFKVFGLKLGMLKFYLPALAVVLLIVGRILFNRGVEIYEHIDL